ncbi:unnamed protein product [Rhizophagus irregularis]|nr:unnamed protein product [Rhizophagus irregularis]CAB5355594.1 unnamed protein product [Rhizophagus irregularis]
MPEKQTKIQDNTLAIEIPLEIETKDDFFDNIKEHKEEIEEVKEENEERKEGIEKHKKSIYKIFVSHYMDDTYYNAKYGPIHDDYVVTYSYQDNSFLGWLVDTEKNGPQKPDNYYKHDRQDDFSNLKEYMLCKKILFLRTSILPTKNWLIDLSGERLLELKQPIYCKHGRFGKDAIGFLLNGDLIQVSVNDRKIYKYCLKDKPENTAHWKYSQIYDIEILENYLSSQFTEINCSIYQTKLFLIVKKENNETLILQFDLLTMNLEKHYNSNIRMHCYSWDSMMNKNQTLLAIGSYDNCIFSTENGMLISKFDANYKVVRFITLKNNSERLVIRHFDENKLQHETTEHNSIYTLSTFQSMLNEINEEGIKKFEDALKDKSLFGCELLKIAIDKLDDKKNEMKKTKGMGIEMIISKEDEMEMIKKIAITIIKDATEISKFGWIAINEKCDDIIQQIVDKIINLIKDDSENYSYMTLLSFISLNLPKLCHYYPDFLIKYISCTSIILSPYCNSMRRSTNTSLNSYSKFIKKSDLNDKYFKSISSLYKLIQNHLWIHEEIQTISFIVPFPQICVYQDDYHEAEDNNKSKIITILRKLIKELKIIMIPEKNKDRPNNIWNEFLHKPKSILFCNIDSNNFYKWWNFAAIVDFKWKTYGRIYYYSIWFFYTLFYICYSLASTIEQNSLPDFYRKFFFIISIIFGSLFLIFEIRQCLWDYKIYFNDTWNLFDVGAYLLPIISSIFWLINKNQPLWLMAISVILLSFRFLLFFRVLKSSISADDVNDPRNLATKYDFINPNGTISNATTMIQDPDSNTNLFNWFPTSLLAVYKIITGDSGSLSPWTFRENPTMTVLLVAFTFFTVIYLMNLFIGLLNLAIGDYNREEEFLLQKARIIMEIELFYMFPFQRYNNKEWFPEWIYYDMPVTEVRKLINAIDNDNKTEFNYYRPIISEKLRKLIAIEDEVISEKSKELVVIEDEDKKEKLNKLENNIKELKQQIDEQNQQMRELLNGIIKGLNIDINNKIEEKK